MKGILIPFFLFLIPCLSFAQNDSLKFPPPPPPNSSNTNKGIFDKVEREATFPGGDSAYKNFIKSNLQLIADSAAERKIKKGNYIIDLTFIIDLEGNAWSYKTESNPRELFLEKAFMEMIQKSPQWVPAMQNGRIVKAFRRQKLTLEIDY